jgi:hypothetical protein
MKPPTNVMWVFGGFDDELKTHPRGIYEYVFSTNQWRELEVSLLLLLLLLLFGYD